MTIGHDFRTGRRTGTGTRHSYTAPCMQTEDDRVLSGIVAIALLHFNRYSDIVAIVSLQVVEYRRVQCR